jgi:peptidoglycan hydrolase CwlO-like protein
VYHDNLELEILQKQIEDVKNRIKAKQEMIKVHKNKTSSIENEIKKYALMLCNSIDYKVDLPCL